MKPIIQEIRLSKEQLQEVEAINKGMTLARTKLIKNHNMRHEYEYHVPARPLSEKQQRDRIRKIYGGVCCVCSAWPNYKVLYDMQGAKRVERYCTKHYHAAFVKGVKK